MSFCINCGTELPDDSIFCHKCGAKISNKSPHQFDPVSTRNEKVCKACGQKMPSDAFYCFNCGESFEKPVYIFDRTDIQQSHYEHMGQWRNKWISLLLCVLFGWLGIHRFYEKRIGSGILYLFSFGIFGIGWIFDIFRLAFSPNPYLIR